MAESANVGSIHYDLSLDTSKWDKAERSVNDKLDGMAKSTGQFVSKVTKTFALAGVAATTFAVKSAADFEQTRIGLENMLGSADKARKVLKEVSSFAAATPFEFPELAESVRQLVAFGFSADDAVKTMKELGDVSAAVGAPIQDLSYLMGTLRAQGRAFTIDIRQFAMRGIPIYEYLAKVFHTNTQEVTKLIEAGKVGFPEVQKAFELMTAQGGVFHGTMEKQSKSLNGLLSTLKDNLTFIARNALGLNNEGDIAKNSIFAKLEDGVNSLIKSLNAHQNDIVNALNNIVSKFQNFFKMMQDTFKSGGWDAVVQQLMLKFTEAFIKALPSTIQTFIVTIVAFGPRIITAFIEGIFQAAKQHPLDFVQMLLALGFIPAKIVGALGTVLAESLPMGIGSMAAFMLKVFAGAGRLVTAPIKALFREVGIGAVGALRESLAPIASLGRNILGHTQTAVGSVSSTILGLFRSLGRNIANILSSGVRDNVGNIINAVKYVIGRPLAAANDAAKAFYSVGKNIVMGMVRGVKDMAGSLVDSVKGVVSGAVNKAKDILGIHSPSRVFQEIGQNVGQGFINGLAGTNAQVRDSAKKLVDTTISSVKSKLSDLSNNRQNMISSISSSILPGITDIAGDNPTSESVLSGFESNVVSMTRFAKSMANLAKAGISQTLIQQIAQAGPGSGKSIADAILGGISRGQFTAKTINQLQGQLTYASQKVGAVVGDAFYSSGIQSMQGLLKGLKSRESAIINELVNLAKRGSVAFKQALGIRSPSKVFADIGRNMVMGMVVGIGDTAPQLHRTLAGLANGAAVGMSSQTVFNGPINIGSRGDADYLLQRMDRNVKLASMGVSPL